MAERIQPNVGLAKEVGPTNMKIAKRSQFFEVLVNVDSIVLQGLKCLTASACHLASFVRIGFVFGVRER
jgi:hypothetical protein